MAGSVGRQKKRSWGVVCAGVLLVVSGTHAAAQDGAGPSLPWKKAELRAGLFVPIYESDLRIDSSRLGRGTSINLEDDLGLDREIFTYRIDGYWRMFRRHTLYFSYIDVSRESDLFLDRTIRIGDRTFTLGANISSSIETRVYQVHYAYSFINNEKFDVAANLGAYVADLEFRFSAPVIGAETESFLAPLPVVGLRASYAINPRLFLSGGANVFFIEYEDYSGRLIDANITLNYDLTENLGVGLGYNHNLINLELDDEDHPVSMDIGYGALMLYLRVFL